MKKVFMYTLSTCPWCRKTKKYFTDNKIRFEFVDYDLQPPEEQAKIEKRMMERGGNMAFPWVLIGDDLVIGWNPEKYSELMGLSKAR
ncbi:MAG: glutaredoxin family protein [Chloroflexi bacterium]|nr:glutaredoxin family protein [Chloroflexota bacterium]